jgi:UDP-glucose 4-epimerase
VTETYLLFGGHGVLGTGYRTALSRRRANVIELSPRWDLPGDAARLLVECLPAAAERGDVVVVWAAGTGGVGASSETMRAETETFVGVCQAVRGQAARRHAGVCMLFASSAGALFGAHGSDVIDADADPVPATPYGFEKLHQEETVRTLADDGCRVVICRYSNLYGLADGRLTSRGFVATALRATRLRQPMIVYVSPDTRRDLVFNVDAAAESLALLRNADAPVTTGLVCAGETRTVAEIMALIGRVSGRRVPATYADRPETRLQPRVLRFRRTEGQRTDVRRTPMETALHLMLRAPLAP